jgi:hypothetical protein
METHLKIIGILLILLASVHAIFPRYFHWREELSSLSLINRQLMYVHTFFIALLLLLIGLLCVTSSKDLIETELGNRIALGLFIFWFARLLIQFFGYSSKLWKGKAFETTIHILFSMLWLYFTTVFFVVYWFGNSV